MLSDDRPKRIDGDERRPHRGHFSPNALEHRVEVAARRLRGQVDEPHRRGNARRIEEIELRLVAEHLDRRFAEHREIERRPFTRRVGEQNLLHERRLSRPWRARDEVERKLAQAAAEDSVEARHARGDVADHQWL